MTLDLITPAELRLQADYDRRAGTDRAPDGWVFHWPGVSRQFTGTVADSAAALRAIERDQQRRGWWGVAYDYGVDLGGHPYLLRGTGRSGATSGDYDEDGIPNNRESDAVLLLLGIGQRPTWNMIATAAALVHGLGGTRSYVIGHREARGTVTPCPGDLAMRYVVAPIARGERPDLDGERPDQPAPPPAPTPPTPAPDWRERATRNMPFINLSAVTTASRTWPRGIDVRRLQALLVANGHAPRNTIRPDGTLDGIGGPGTRRAVRAFQKAAGLTVDAKVGRRTWSALLGVSS